MISPCLPSAILQNLQFPHLLPFELKQYREFSPPQGHRIQYIPLYSPTYFPGWPGVRTKTVLKINWSVKTQWHERMEVARFGLWASDKITRGALFFSLVKFSPAQATFERVLTPTFWKIFACENRNPGRESFALWSGIRDLESGQVPLFQYFSLVTKNPESSTWNLESMVWKPES